MILCVLERSSESMSLLADSIVFWHATPFNLLEVYRHIRVDE